MANFMIELDETFMFGVLDAHNDLIIKGTMQIIRTNPISGVYITIENCLFKQVTKCDTCPRARKSIVLGSF